MQSNRDVLISGGGSGGSPTVMALASPGKQVLMVESGEGLGRTCLFEGGIPPSKITREAALQDGGFIHTNHCWRYSPPPCPDGVHCSGSMHCLALT